MAEDDFMDSPVNFSANEEDDVFLDLLMLTLAGFMSMVLLLLPYINPPTAPEMPPPPGDMLVEMAWPDAINVDMDLWVKAPDHNPVGYSRKSGPIFNLLRDDLGRSNDLSLANYEVAYSRGLPAGEYVVNIHWYAYELPTVPVEITISLVVDGITKRIFHTIVNMEKVGQEVTVVRLMIDEAGLPVPGSFHNLPMKLRSR